MEPFTADRRGRSSKVQGDPFSRYERNDAEIVIGFTGQNRKSGKEKTADNLNGEPGKDPASESFSGRKESACKTLRCFMEAQEKQIHGWYSISPQRSFNRTWDAG